jgi:succinate dehydrogenase/fumarate reductase flavoprotein subunit
MDGATWLQAAQLGANLGGIMAVLALLAGGRLVARSWADAVVTQANHNAHEARKAAEAADTRADLLHAALVEQTAAIRAMEALVRSSGLSRPPARSPDGAEA